MLLECIKKFIQNKRLKIFFAYFFVFSFFFAIFYSLQFSFSYLADTDPWYHIKQAWLIRTHGVEFSVKNFPWLQHTILKDYPADLWFGYHLLLFPFTFGDLIFWAKLSSVIFASFVFVVFFWLLKRLKVKYPLFWTFPLFFVTHFDFIYRLLLTRPHTLSITFSLLVIYFIYQKRYLEIFLLALFWSFVTPEVLLIVGMSLLWVLIEFFKEKKVDWKMLALPPLGIFLSLLIRPDFPNNLYLLFHQVFTLLYLRFIGVPLNFGAELSTPFAIRAVKDNIFLFFSSVFITFYVLFFFIERKIKKIPTFHLFLISLTLGIGAIALVKSMRFIELWIPFTLLSTAVITEYWLLPNLSQGKKNIRDYQNFYLPFKSQLLLKIYQRIYSRIRFFVIDCEKIIKVSFLSTILILIFYLLFSEIYFFYRTLSTLPPTLSSYIKTMEKAANWLKNNTPPHSVVMNKMWHTFPFLFFWNHQNYYCCGMDPTFMYLKDKTLYWLWQNIPINAKICEREKCPEGKSEEELNDQELFLIFKEKFKADYILLETQGGFCSLTGKALPWFEKFRKTLQESEYFEKVFEEGVIQIYKIK